MKSLWLALLLPGLAFTEIELTPAELAGIPISSPGRILGHHAATVLRPT